MSEFSEVDEPSWPDILRGVQDQLQARIHVALPAAVRSYDSATQRAVVQPTVQVGGVTLPQLGDVPVCWPGGAAGFLHVPLAIGDTVLLVFSEEDFSQWWATGSISAPAVLQRHGLHAVAIPGLRARDASFAATSGHVTLAGTSHVRLGSDAATDFVALASVVGQQLQDLKDAIAGWVVAPGDGGAALKAALTAWLASSSNVAATKVKAI